MPRPSILRYLTRHGLVRCEGGHLEASKQMNKSFLPRPTDREPYLREWVEALTPLKTGAQENGEILLTDAGDYDYLGVEPAWKSYRTLFISEAGDYRVNPDLRRT
jgi:hypothetical protein